LARLLRLQVGGGRHDFGLTLGLCRAGSGHNAGMKFFYGFMLLVMAATLLPSALYMGIYVFTGADEALERARKLWNFLRVFTLLGFNLMLWGHVLVAAWQLFH
jgi:hypothetical protein